MIPVYIETITDCAVCGEVACERDLLYLETAAEADAYECEIGDVICRECATGDGTREASETVTV